MLTAHYILTNVIPSFCGAHAAMIVELPTKAIFRVALQIYLMIETCMCKYAHTVMIKERTRTRPKPPKLRAWAGDGVNKVIWLKTTHCFVITAFSIQV